MTYNPSAGAAGFTPSKTLDLGTDENDAVSTPPASMVVANSASLTGAGETTVSSGVLTLAASTVNSEVQNTKCNAGRFDWQATPVAGAPISLTARLRASAGVGQYVTAMIYLGSDEEDPGDSGSGSHTYLVNGMGRDYLGSGGNELATRRGAPSQVSGQQGGIITDMGDWIWFRIVVAADYYNVMLLRNTDTGATEPTSGWVQSPGGILTIDSSILGQGTIRAGVQAAPWNALGTYKMQCSYLKLTGATVT